MTLRARLLVGMVAIAVVLAGAAALTIRTTRAHLVAQVDDQLRAAEIPPPDGPFRRRGPGEVDRPSALFVAMTDATGNLTVRFEADLIGEPLSPPDLDARSVLAATPGTPFTVDSIDGETRYRAMTRRAPRNELAVVYALSLADVDDAVRRLVGVLGIATLVVVTVLGVVTWWVIRLGVRPLKRMTETAATIAAGDLSHRVPAGEPGTEAGELGDALNRMMEAIEGAFADRTASEERLRQFVHDASHELRTPVTTIRGYAELYRAGGLDDPAELSEAMRRTEQEAVRMGSLVDDLLHLARLDQGRPLERAPVDIAVLARDAVRDARAVDPARPLSVVADGELVVEGDEARLRQVVANLVTNAIVHTDASVPVTVRARREGDEAVLEVVDHGEGMPPDVSARAFERFFRADPARTRHRGGSGLGLAIVEATVGAHGGRVAIDSTVGAGTTVTVRLPISR